ncbi:sugar nucleotide-binding protein [Cecembia rubra]|uniref:dTDP-4-dehydrorhamnose reductase n=1 Tax=Cecembia rubra TaxID=1485585 RepID=A0A2P8EA12_9BACT|nr:sugar nucleotide-binding protein [Cecembia rubra]PSL06311.1 dTDP-4-dehydrorhamnose reductase [Cecembia rubra]
MKFLILGSNGMAGHTIGLYLEENGHEVLGFGKKKSVCFKSIEGNAFDTKLLNELITYGKFDAIVNCIGILNETAEKFKAEAVFLNSYLPHFLANLTEGLNTQVIHMSTDCVFSGQKGEYEEHDFPDGTTFYDRSKALGELDDKKNITLRNSIIGPDLNPGGIGLLNWFMQQTGEIKGFTKSIWTGQTTLQLAKTIEYVSKEKAFGLFNAVPEQSISKFDLLNLFNVYLRKDSLKIVPVEGIIANKSLKRTKFKEILIPDYETMIYELSIWIKKYNYLYPHYNSLKL